MNARILLLALGGAFVSAGAPLALQDVLHDVLRDAPPPAHTGGFGEPTCLACHSSHEPNDPRGSLIIAGPEFYTAGATYELRVRLKHPDLRAGGFELSVRDRSGQQAGRFVMDTARTGRSSQSDVVYVHHTRASTIATGDSIVWAFDWVAPDEMGDIIIHAAANAADDDESPLGDFVFVHSLTIPVRRAER